MDLRFYDTARRKKVPFEPIDPQNVRMYVCGPTVYDRAHLGNARPVVVFDVLNRLLRHVYGEDHVTYVRNFTDVDDKINATALARKEAGADGTLEELIRARSDETIAWYRADMDALAALRPDHEPRATDFVGQMIAMTAALIEKGHAYAAEGHVLFAVESYENYGALSGRSVDDMIAGARVEVAPYKRNPMDFVLWKPSDAGLPGWDSPWGRGRPGWHIECSAMAAELLGEQFDIHGGGIDLTFPHHENEIAQSACMGHGFAGLWMHNEMLQVEGKKMSKSLGNFFTVRDLLEIGPDRFDVPDLGPALRMRLLTTHYRDPMDWTEATLSEAVERVARFAEGANCNPIDAADVPELLEGTGLVEALANDLNTSKAITILEELFKDALMDLTPGPGAEEEKYLNRRGAQLTAGLALLGFDPETLTPYLPYRRRDARKTRFETNVPGCIAAIDALTAERLAARQAKDWGTADAIRDRLAGADVQLSEGTMAVTWWFGPKSTSDTVKGLLS